MTVAALPAHVRASLAKLLDPSPACRRWSLARADTCLERTYVFPNLTAARSFGDSVATLARARGHDPEWAGCGRRVFIRWTTHRPSPARLGELDVMCAVACEEFAAGVERNDTAYCEYVTRLWPEWRRIGRRNGRTGTWWAAEMAGLWEWVRNRALVEEEKPFWPAWGMVYGMACVSQAMWAHDGTAQAWHQGSEIQAAMEKISRETNPGNAMSSTVEQLMREVVRGHLSGSSERRI